MTSTEPFSSAIKPRWSPSGTSIVFLKPKRSVQNFKLGSTRLTCSTGVDLLIIIVLSRLEWAAVNAVQVASARPTAAATAQIVLDFMANKPFFFGKLFCLVLTRLVI